MPRNQKDFTYDNALLLKDAGAITASAAGTVAAVARVLDLGQGRLDARVIVDISAISVSVADQLYGVEVQLSDVANFATGIRIGSTLRFGHQTATGESAGTVIGRYENAFTNELNGVIYRYARAFARIAGTTPSINFTAYIVQQF